MSIFMALSDRLIDLVVVADVLMSPSPMGMASPNQESPLAGDARLLSLEKQLNIELKVSYLP